MRKGWGVRAAAIAAVGGAAGAALAQPETGHLPTTVVGGGPTSQAGSSGPAKDAPLVLRRAQFGTQALIDAGHARMKKGDCAGALDAFDEALRASTDPSLYRDRGECHEELHEPFPAIDDYRVYLTRVPDAPDADAIRGRLQALEATTSGRVHPSGAGDDDPFASVHGAAEKGARSDPTTAWARSPAASDTFDDDAIDVLHGPLRAGRGLSLAPLFSERKWIHSDVSFAAGQTWSETIGAQLRIALSPHGAVVVEAGYERFNATDANLSVASGLSAQVAYELRWGLDNRYDNQLLIQPGVGFEHLAYAPNTVTSSTYAVGGVVGRLRAGWRHMLAASVALDVAIDGGIGDFFYYQTSPSPPTADLVGSAGLVGLEVSVGWGL